MQGVLRYIIDRQVRHFNRVDPNYGAGVLVAIAKTNLPPTSASKDVAHAAE